MGIRAKSEPIESVARTRSALMPFATGKPLDQLSRLSLHLAGELIFGNLLHAGQQQNLSGA
jgi:hypothetical protein